MGNIISASFVPSRRAQVEAIINLRGNVVGAGKTVKCLLDIVSYIIPYISGQHQVTDSVESSTEKEYKK